jgi:hypothetical protein
MKKFICWKVCKDCYGEIIETIDENTARDIYAKKHAVNVKNVKSEILNEKQ